MLKNSGTQEKDKKTYIVGNTNFVIQFEQSRKIKKFDFSQNYFFSCYQQTSPLGVLRHKVSEPDMV